MDELSTLKILREEAGQQPEQALLSARTLLMERAVAEEQAARRTGTAAGRPDARQPGRPGWRRPLLAAGISAAATFALVAALVAGDAFGPRGASAEASEVLNTAATAALHTEDPVLRPGQYLHITSKGIVPFEIMGTGETPTVTMLETANHELWIPADISATWVRKDMDRKTVQYLTPGTEGTPGSGTKGSLQRSMRGEFQGPRGDSWQVPSLDFLAGLPRDPEALLDRIYKDSQGQGSTPDDQAFVVIGDLLSSNIVPADLRAALFKAARLIPGVDVSDSAAVLDHRVGVAIGSENKVRGERTELVFDPGTGQLIGQRVVQTRSEGGIPAGTVIFSSADTREVVDKAP
jgi:hypothetical protein